MSITSTVGLRCCLCGRELWNPAVYIEDKPVGPVCAKRHGLIALAQRGGAHTVRFPTHARTSKPHPGDTHKNLELFPEL